MTTPLIVIVGLLLPLGLASPGFSGPRSRHRSRRSIAEILGTAWLLTRAKAAKFEWLAEIESDPKLKAQLAEQAAAYRKLARDRAKALGLPLPSPEQPPADRSPE